MIRSTAGLDPTVSKTQGDGRAGYATVRDVERRARSTAYGQDAATRTALDRLDRLLTAGKPLRRDVLPGYHLDVEV